MTLQQVHARLSLITEALKPGLPSHEVARLQSELLALVDALPISEEFDATAEALQSLAFNLQKQVTQTVCNELRSRTAILSAAVGVLARVSQEAALDARQLSFEKPTLVVAGLKNSISLAQEVHAAVKRQDLEAIGEKTEALLAVLTALRSNVKVG